MASSYDNNLRLEEIGSGERSGTWGTATNTNLSLITDAFGYGTEAITTNADTHTTTIANAESDPGRAMYLKYTGTLDSECTITLAPATVSKVWIIENATSGSQSIAISNGSGTNVTIPNGSVKFIYSTGDTSGNAQNVVDAFTDLDVSGTFKVAGNTTVGGTLTSTGAVTANAGVVVDNITIDGTEIDLSSGDLTLDVAGDIVLNSDDGIIFLKDDTATFGSLNNSSGNLIIKSGTTTAATFSGANVTLAGTVVTGGLTTLGGNLVIPNTGNIGSVGDPDAIAISSTGVVTFSQNITGTLGTASQTNITSVGTLNVGAISSGFGAIDNGSSAITTTGTITFGNLVGGAGGSTVTGVLDENDFSSNSDTKLATQQSIKAYVDTQASGSTGIMGSGTGNTGIGSNVLDSMTGDEADYNTAFGFNAGTALTTGDRNVHVGYNAGYLSTAGSSNVYIGAYAGDAGTGNSEGNNTCVGDSAGSSITDGSENTCLGQGAGSAITTATFQTALGRESLLSNQTNAANTAVGAGSMGYIRGDNNTAVGNDSLIGKSSSVSSGANNTAIGKGAMGGNAMTDASKNVAVGTTALPALTSADKNTVSGFESAKRLTSGANNVIIGNKSGLGVITGSHNVAIGGEATMGFGDISLLENESAYNAFTVGDRNVAVGSRAMNNSASASAATEKNTATGYGALSLVQGGDNNTGFGYLAGDNITDGTNNTCIGYLSDAAAADSDNSITLGNSSISSLRCADTSISSLSDERDKKDIVDSTYGLDLLKTFRPVSFTWNKRPDTRTKPSWMSDEEWKEEQDAISNAVDPYKDRPAIGFLAQELRDAVPESDRKRLDLVDEQNPDRLEAKQGKLIPILVKALQELSAKNDALEARIKTLEG